MNANELIVTYGTDIEKMTTDLLLASKIELLIGDQERNIMIKPNLVVPVTPDTGATTHVEIIRSVIRYLQAHGFSHITIGEGSWVGAHTEDAFQVNDYYGIVREFHVGLKDLKKGPFITKEAEGITMQIAKEALDSFLISLPVLKGHCQTLMTCALKNMKGILSDSSKRMFHTLGLDKPIAALNSIKHADFVLVDSICGDLDFEEGGNPIPTDRMIAGRDSVLIDSYGSSLMGFRLGEIPYIGYAESLGVGSHDLEKATITTLAKPDSIPAISQRKAQWYAQYVDQRNACSACYGNLVHALRKLEEEGEIPPHCKIRIGQGFREHKEGGCLGIGSCTGGLKGCPPSANDMIAYLKEHFQH